MAAVDSANLFIPLVDFSHFLHGTQEQKQEAAKKILFGFQTAGFVYLKNHGVPEDLLAKAYAASAEFFKRPQAEKEALGWTTPAANRGYVSHGREKVTQLTSWEDVEKLRQQVPDLKESIEIGREGEPGHPNNWPTGDDEAVNFKNTMVEFFGICQDTHMEVMRAIAVGMGLDPTYFDHYTDIGDNTLRLLHYPSTPKSVFKENKLQVRAGEHSDYGSLTLLFQDDRGGLQVKDPKGNFIDATPIPGTVVVNAGDLLARWSNDTIKSTLHRVVEPPASKNVEGDVYPARYSIAYFCNPNFSSQIEAIDGTFGGAKGERIYEGINSGKYIEGRLAATY